MQDILLIWDFDGVIADTEKLWLQTRMNLLNKTYNTNWDFKTTNKYLGGTSDKTKKEVLDKLGIKTDEKFWTEANKLDMEKVCKGISLTPGIEDIFKLPIKQCIGTGGVWEKTFAKIELAGIKKYFGPSNVFTADLVSYGKPEPDIFLFAAHAVGYTPDNCVVIEDSIAGLTAAIKAKMIPVAFVGAEMYDDCHVKKIKEMGIEYIFYNMKELKKFIIDNYG
jgi:beta-phosphoglucomutase-like phosphatase (HAD superfamily)